jgi:acetoin utilization protein AcuB
MSRMPWTIDREESLTTAHELMRKHQVRHLPVTAEGKLVGLLSLRDLHLIETLADVDQDEVRVAEAMTTDPYKVAPGDPIDQVAAMMAHNKWGSAVVVEGPEIQGIFTTIDALIALLHVWKPVP